MECLASIPQLRAKGIAAIEHKQRNTYYDALLGRYRESGKAIMDDDATKNHRMVDARRVAARPFEVVPRAPLALQDELGLMMQQIEDGEPSSDEGEEEEDLSEMLDAKKANIVDWHPFRIRVMRRKVAAGVSLQREAECPFHRDPLDPVGTKCKKAMKFNSEQEKIQVLSKVKMWCLQGRACRNRAFDESAHKAGNPATLAVLPDDQLERLKAYGLSQPTWILESGPEAAPKDALVPVAAAKCKAKQVQAKKKSQNQDASSRNGSSASSSSSESATDAD